MSGIILHYKAKQSLHHAKQRKIMQNQGKQISVILKIKLIVPCPKT